MSASLRKFFGAWNCGSPAALHTTVSARAARTGPERANENVGGRFAGVFLRTSFQVWGRANLRMPLSALGNWSAGVSATGAAARTRQARECIAPVYRICVRCEPRRRRLRTRAAWPSTSCALARENDRWIGFEHVHRSHALFVELDSTPSVAPYGSLS